MMTDDRDWTMLDSEDIATLLKCSRSQAYRSLTRSPAT